MSKPPSPLAVRPDSWAGLRRFTDARIALGRCGASLPTAAHLAFQAAHAQARDAVHTPLDTAALMTALAARNWPALRVSSAAPDRPTYLRRPDLGRRLSPDSQELLSGPMAPCEVVVVVADGLSSAAITANALPVLTALIPLLGQAGRKLGPILVASQARVALGDPIGEALQAEVSIMLIGERPGLSAMDSLGLYLTWMPRPGRVDAERNCISNVRTGGMAQEEAARQAALLVDSMKSHRSGGIALADQTSATRRP